jgi:hypothetical protein
VVVSVRVGVSVSVRVRVSVRVGVTVTLSSETAGPRGGRACMRVKTISVVASPLCRGQSMERSIVIGSCPVRVRVRVKIRDMVRIGLGLWLALGLGLVHCVGGSRLIGLW